MAQTIRTASGADAVRAAARIIVPTVAKGAVIRRPLAERAAERFALDEKAIETMQALRRRYGGAALRLGFPLRPQLLLLDAADVERVLLDTPVPFATRSVEKAAALQHFEPGNVLISTPDERRRLRPMHDAALCPREAHHPCAPRFRAIVDDEFVTRQAERGRGRWDWPRFATAWFRLVRRVVFGDAAAGDEALRLLLNRLRGRANWSYLMPKDRVGRARLLARIAHLADSADAQALAARMPEGEERASQIAQWLFAFDSAGMATFRMLALLAVYPQQAPRLRDEAAMPDPVDDFARRCFLESVRLWPTVPAILRETGEDVLWGDEIVPAGTGIMIYAPFFLRDDLRIPQPHVLQPDLWLSGDAVPAKGLIPFSAGAGLCPAHSLVPQLAAMVAAALLGEGQPADLSVRLDPHHLQGTLDHYRLSLSITARAAVQSSE